MSLAPLVLNSPAFTHEMGQVKSESEKHLPALFHYLDKFIGLAVQDGKNKLFDNKVDFKHLLHSHRIKDAVDLSKDTDLQNTFIKAADRDYAESAAAINNPLDLAQHLDSVIDLQASISSGSQTLLRSKFFISPVLEMVKTIASKVFNAAKPDHLKELSEISKAISKQERANETEKLFDRLNSAKPKILIFDIDGTLRPLEAGSAGHITPSLDENLIADLKKVKDDTRYQIYFVTTRPESEIRKSNVLEAGIPVFCENGRVKINAQGQTEKTVQDLDPDLSKATESMQKSIEEYVRTNYLAPNNQESSGEKAESLITDIFTLPGSVCFGIKANDFTGMKQSLLEDLNNFTSNRDWEVKEYGRFIELRHKRFNADKFRPVAQILMDNHVNGTARKEDVYIFGDQKVEYEATRAMDNVNHHPSSFVLVGNAVSGEGIGYKLKNPESLKFLVSELAAASASKAP